MKSTLGVDVKEINVIVNVQQENVHPILDMWVLVIKVVKLIIEEVILYIKKHRKEMLEIKILHNLMMQVKN